MRFAVKRYTILVLVLLLFFGLILCQGMFLSRTASASQMVEQLWGITQECHFPIADGNRSLDGAVAGFDDLTAACKGAFAQGNQEKYWATTEFEHTDFQSFSSVRLDVRFYFWGWSNDIFALQLSQDGGNTWMMLEEFTEAHPPPAELTTRGYELTEFLNISDIVNIAQIRIVGVDAVGTPEVVEIFLDGARLVVTTEILEKGDTFTPTQTVQNVAIQLTYTPSGMEITSPTPVENQLGGNKRTPTATASNVSSSPTTTPILLLTATPSSTSTPTQSNAPEIEPTATRGKHNTQVPSPTPTAVLTEDPPNTPTTTLLATYTPLPSTTTPAQTETSTATLTLTPAQSITSTPTATSTLTPEQTEIPTDAPAPVDPIPMDLDSGSPHGGFYAFTDSCAGCHNSHTSQGPQLQSAWPEEQICFSCHSEQGAASMDVESAFTSQPNTGTAFFSHPVELTAGVHELSALEIFSSSFGLENRHVECVDCHNPHDSGNQAYVPAALQDQVRGATGVYPLYDGQGAPVEFAWLATAQYEYQLCYKCHSSYVLQPDYPPAGWDGFNVVLDGLAKLTNPEPEQVLDSRDMALEFNPQNTSFHPVMSAGKNPNIPAESFVPGWSTDSLVYCSDCHNNPSAAAQGSGPHGPRLHLLNEQTSLITVNTGRSTEYTSEEVCFQCHRFETYVSSPSLDKNTNFRKSNRNLHHNHSDDGSCYMCHDSHGSEQLHLINLDASINNIQENQLVFYGGYDGQPTNSQTFWQISPDGDEKTCFISCHGHTHTAPGQRYPNYTDDLP